MERIDEQDSTDFMKCVELVRARDPLPSSLTTTAGSTAPAIISEAPDHRTLEERQTSNLGIIALGGTGGRFDQSMSSIHHLYILNQERQATLVSDESIVVVLGAVSLLLPPLFLTPLSALSTASMCVLSPFLTLYFARRYHTNRERMRLPVT